MNVAHRRQASLPTQDDHDIFLRTWEPSESPVGIIQVLHGLGEHGDRYERFARLANARGLVVGCHDHRGHGRHAATAGFFAASNGWQRVVDDALRVNEHLRDAYPQLPLSLLGHSMGSYVAQDFAMHYGARIDALILSASTRAPRALTAAGHLLARIECWRLGSRFESALLDKLGFGDLNKPFEPGRTEYDWLSRDDAEVDAYIADPLCGGPYTAGLWRDLTAALFRIAAEDNIARVPSDLPILITGGADDAVGGDKGMGDLTLYYAQTGHQRLQTKIYPGGRHEMLNETNRDAVSADWLDWILDNTKKSPAQ
jgi:alpha-beta hydrolase superfamily lysophospholipase